MRTALASIVSLTLAGSACSSSPIPSAPSAAAPADAWNETATASRAGEHKALAAIRRATAIFHDVSKAVEAGYLAPDSVHCVESPDGAMGVHSVHPLLIGDQVIDPARPEVLLYLPKNGGGFRLVGVEYFQAILLRNPATGAVAPWFAPTPWPPEYQVLTAQPSVFGQEFDGPMPGHEPGMPWHYDLHVWAWAPNPSGDFAPFNPRLSCSGS